MYTPVHNSTYWFIIVHTGSYLHTSLYQYTLDDSHTYWFISVHVGIHTSTCWFILVHTGSYQYNILVHISMYLFISTHTGSYQYIVVYIRSPQWQGSLAHFPARPFRLFGPRALIVPLVTAQPALYPTKSTPFPPKIVGSPTLGDGQLTVKFFERVVDNGKPLLLYYTNRYSIL